MTIYKQFFLFATFVLAVATIYIHQNVKSTIQQNPKLMPGEWMASQRMYPYNEIKTDVYLQEMKKAQLMTQQSAKSDDLQWELVGPTNIGGRITDIEVPADQSDIIYVGAASGGVFKTEDQGSSW